MRGLITSFCLCAIAAVGAQEPVPAVRDAPRVGEIGASERGISRSRGGRLLVYGESIELRRAIVALADEAHREFLLLFQKSQQDKPTSNTVVQLLKGDASGVPLRTRIYALEGAADRHRLDLYVNLARGIDTRQLQRELLRLSLIEQALRLGEDTEERDFSVPEWLVVGIAEAVAWRNGRGDRELYVAVMESGSSPSMEELFAAQAGEMADPISKMAFRVWSGALVMSLLEADVGAEPVAGPGEDDARKAFAQQREAAQAAFKSFVMRVVGFEGEIDLLLRSEFPGLNLSENSLKKLIALKVANLSRARLDERMNVEQTERELERILRPPLDNGSELGDRWLWDALPTMEERARVEAQQQAVSRLVRLSYRAFPLHKEVIAGYSQVISRRMAATDAETADAIARLEQIRERLLSDARRARDVLDWYEVNQREGVSGELRDYVKLREEAEKAPPRRGDGLSKYLDRAQEVFGGE